MKDYIKNPELCKDLPFEELLKISEEINPYNDGKKSEDNSHIILSITDFNRQYLNYFKSISLSEYLKHTKISISELVMYNWNLYENDNLEKLMKMTDEFLGGKTILKYAVKVLGYFESKEKALDYLENNKEKIKTEVYVIQMNEWNYIADKKEDMNFISKR